MLYDLHTATTAYFTYLRSDDAAWNDATALGMRARIVRLAARAGVRGATFQRFVIRVAAQVATS